MPTRIVIVDDHKMVRDGFRLFLEREPDFTVVGEAANAEDAYECIGRTAPDIALLDLNLPGVHGFSATTQIRARWPKVRIIIVTGEVEPAVAHDALLAGANGFLRKEDGGDELVRAVRAVANGKSYLSPEAATAITDSLVSRATKPEEPVLSEREVAVLKGLASGLSYKEIADKLEISPKSVETYRARLARKTGSTTRAELVRYAIRKRIVEA